MLATPTHKQMRRSTNRPTDNVFDSIDAQWKASAQTKPSRYQGTIARSAQTRRLVAEMRTLTHQSPQLAKMGAIVALCSLIEGRISAMYEDRTAVAAGLPLPSMRRESVEIIAMLQTDATPNTKTVKSSLKRKIDLLRTHGDITSVMAAEYHEFREYRNALIHDAMHHGSLFTGALVNALVDLYADLCKVRRRMRARVRTQSE